MSTGARQATNRPSPATDDPLRRRLLEGIPVAERRLEVDGLPTVVLEGGDGPPMILLHGPGEDAVNWRWVMGDLATHHHVVAPDLPAHGGTAVPEGALTPERCVAWLDDLVDRTCTSPPVIVGHVLGGALAARFAVEHGERARVLVLVDSLGLGPFRPSLKFVFGLLGFQIRPTERSYERFMRQCAYDLDGLRERVGRLWKDFASYNLALARSPKSKAVGRMLRKVGLPRIPPDDLARIPVPTTLVWGRHDRANRLRVAEAASERFGWPLHVVDDAADDPARDRPEAFVAVLRKALEGVGGPGTVEAGRPRRETRAAWDAIAAGFDELVTPTGGWRLPEEALDRAGVGSGTRFLDVACGSGALALPAARRGARVTAVDLSPAMIERLEARVREEGLEHVEARVMDGHALDLDDGVFDVSASQFGVMLFPDLPRGLREMVRVTRPGGRVALVAFGAPERVEFLTFFLAAVRSVVPDFEGFPMDPPPLPFQVADPAVLRRRMREAGLSDVRIEPTQERLEPSSGRELWDWVMNSNPLPGAAVADLTAEQRADVVDVLDGMVRERAGLGGRAVLTAAVNVAVGTK